MINTEKYLFNNPHWEIESIGMLDQFFRALPYLVPTDALLCLAGGAWDDQLKNFLRHHRQRPPIDLDRPIDFLDGVDVPVTTEVIEELSEISNHHAAPEIAMFVAVSHNSEQILEWFDVPGDPLTASLKIPESKIQKFCALTGVNYIKKE
jgi:hypothetical protein